MAFHEGVVDWYLALPGLVQSVVQAVVVFVVGLVVIGVLRGWFGSVLTRSKRIDQTLRDFLLALFHAASWGLLAVAVLYVFGVSGALLGGMVAVAGFVVGFAMKDSLSNLAAGATLLIYRPFKVNDVVEIGGQTGKVEALGLAMTTIRLYDARLATIANGQVLGNTIVNFTREPKRMADIEVGISYEDDIETAIKVILRALEEDERVLSDPAPEVRVRALADSGVTLHVRPWVKTADLWKGKADFHRVVKKALEAAGCTIPFPQRDIHIIPSSNGADEDAGRRREDSAAKGL